MNRSWIFNATSWAVGLTLWLSAALSWAADAPTDLHEYGRLWQEVKTGWGAETERFQNELRQLKESNLPAEELQKATRKLVDAHMQTAREYAAKRNRIFNEANRQAGTTPSAGADPVRGRGMAGGDLDFAGTPAETERLVKTLGEMGIPQEDLGKIERTTSRVTVGGMLNFTVNYRSGTSPVGSEEHRMRIEQGARDVEHALGYDMKKGQAGKGFVTVQDNVKKYQHGGLAAPEDLLDAPEQLQIADKGTLKNINEAKLSEADLKVLKNRHGLTESVDQLVEQMQSIKGKGGHLAPGELHELTAEKLERVQKFWNDVNRAAEWRTYQQARQQLRVGQQIARELATSNDPAIRRQLVDLRAEMIDSRLRIEASLRANQANELEALRARRNGLAHQVDQLRQEGRAAEADKAARKLAELNERITTRVQEQQNFRAAVEATTKAACTPRGPGEAGGGMSQWLANTQEEFLSGKMGPRYHAANRAVAGWMLGTLWGEEYKHNRDAGRGAIYSASGASLKTGAMMHPLGIVYMGVTTSWNVARGEADAYVAREKARLEAEGKDWRDESNLRSIAMGARIRGTLYGTTYGAATTSMVLPILFPASSLAIHAGPAGFAFLSVSHAVRLYADVYHDLKLPSAFEEFNSAERIDTLERAVEYGRRVRAELSDLAMKIQREVESIQTLSSSVDSSENLYGIYRDQLDKDREFLSKVNTEMDALRSAVARGEIDPQATERLAKEFQAVASAADRISADVDRTIGEFQARRIKLDVVRARYAELLQRFNETQQRYLAARQTFERLRMLSQIPLIREANRSARDKIQSDLSQIAGLGEQLREIGGGLDARVESLLKQSEEFKTKRSTALRGLKFFYESRTKAGSSEEAQLRDLIDQIENLSIPEFSASAFRFAGMQLGRSGGSMAILSRAELPPPPSFDGLERLQGPAQTAVFDVTLYAEQAAAALDRAREQLERLAALVESAPPEVVQVPPPPPTPPRPPDPPTQPPAAPPGPASIREASRNVFVVEMANMPRQARFVWDFGDGSPQSQTGVPQVQHNYVASSGVSGLSKLSGKRWQLSVTVYDAASGQAVGNASISVARGGLSDTPIQKHP